MLYYFMLFKFFASLKEYSISRASGNSSEESIKEAQKSVFLLKIITKLHKNYLGNSKKKLIKKYYYFLN